MPQLGIFPNFSFQLCSAFCGLPQNAPRGKLKLLLSAMAIEFSNLTKKKSRGHHLALCAKNRKLNKSMINKNIMQNKKYKLTWGIIPIAIVISLVISATLLIYINKIEKEIPKNTQGELLFPAGTTTKSVVFYDSNGEQTWDWVQGTIMKSPDSDKTFVSITLSYTRYPTESGYEVRDGDIYIANIYDGTCKERGNIRFLLPKIIKDEKGTGYGTYVNGDIINSNTPLSIRLYKQQNFLSNVLVRYGLEKPTACAEI